MDPNHLRVVFYEPSDGATLLFFGPLCSNIHSLRNIFKSLATGIYKEYKLDNSSFISVFQGIEIIFKAAELEVNENVGLKMLDDKHFEFILSTEDWDYFYWYIEKMEDSLEPCHQYLSSHGNDDVCVVVSVGEYEDNLFCDLMV